MRYLEITRKHKLYQNELYTIVNSLAKNPTKVKLGMTSYRPGNQF